MAAAQKLQDAGVTPFANGTKDAWDINEVVMMQLIPSNIGGYEGRMAYLNGERCFNDARYGCSLPADQGSEALPADRL